MDASDAEIAFYVGEADEVTWSLRDVLVEAMMRAEEDAGFLTDSTASAIALDSILDTLEANADEWADRCGNDTGFRPHDYVMNGLIAALRPPVSSSQENP